MKEPRIGTTKQQKEKARQKPLEEEQNKIRKAVRSADTQPDRPATQCNKNTNHNCSITTNERVNPRTEPNAVENSLELRRHWFVSFYAIKSEGMAETQKQKKTKVQKEQGRKE